MKSDTIDLWEYIAQNPTEGYAEFLLKEKEFLLRNVSKNSHVLEIGCGTGRILEFLANSVKELIGIDNNSETLEICKENMKELNNVKLFVEDGEDMGFENKSFDVVIGGLTFVNYGKTKNKILSEIKRVLKDEGLFLFSTYNENALNERLLYYKKFLGNNFTVDQKGNVSLGENYVSEQFTEKEVREIMNENGFEILELIKGKIFYLIKARKK